MSQHEPPRRKKTRGIFQLGVRSDVLGGIREPLSLLPSGRHQSTTGPNQELYTNKQMIWRFNTQQVRGTPADCDAKRVGEATRGSQNQSSLAEISKRRLSKNLQIAVPTRFFPTGSAQERPKDFQHPPKSFPNPSKIDPRSIPKPFWSPSCTHAGKKIDLERPKSGQEAPKSSQKTTQTVPNPS